MKESSKNKNLHKAKDAKKDEFYTQFSDIQQELKYYKNHFKDKVVYCNCDDPYESNFFKYFALKFNELELKKLIATCYIGSPIANTELSLFDFEPAENKTTKVPHKLIINEAIDENNDGAVNLQDIVISLAKNVNNTLTRLHGDGDFRSKECIDLLKQAGIVVTNPPFSLFREYIAQLIEYDKKFLVIGNHNAISYKEIFNFIKENKVWLGYMHPENFVVPDHYEQREYRSWRDEKGVNWRSLGNTCWFTNLDISKRHEDIILCEKYNHAKYPKYDNYDAINVNKVTDIPVNYEGNMGVPITFMDKYSPEQFEIISANDIRINEHVPFKEHGLIKDKEGTINGKPTYVRIVIKNKRI
jgi:hypothetical protein